MPAAQSMEPVDGAYTTPGGLRIAADAVSWLATRSGGPGGQHANTSDTAVTVTIDAERTGLAPAVVARILASSGPTIVATSARSRSQWRNRQIAWADAMGRLDEAATPPPPARARTRPSRSAREERLADKRRAGERKRARQRPLRDD